MADIHHPQIVHIGACRPGHEKIVDQVECGPGIMAGEEPARIATILPHAGNGRSIGKGACVVFGSIDPIGIGCQRMDILQAVDPEGERQKKLAVTSAFAINTVAAGRCRGLRLRSDPTG